jgi:SH3-like domain-containing protein
VVIVPEAELRESPWPDAEIVSTAARGTQADVVEYQDGWFLVRANEREGWVPETVVANAALPAAAAILQVEEVGTE